MSIHSALNHYKASAHQPKRSRKSIKHDEMQRTTSDLENSTQFFISSPQHDSPILSPAPSTHQQQPQPQHFESYQTPTTVVDIDNALEEDEEFVNFEEELDVIQNLMPRSKRTLQLQDELSRVEAEYYRNKAAYFAKLTENSKIKRTLMLLRSRKLQLEIEKLTDDS